MNAPSNYRKYGGGVFFSVGALALTANYNKALPQTAAEVKLDQYPTTEMSSSTT